MQNTAFPNLAKTEFHPELLSRRGEIVAWLLSLILIATWALLALLDEAVFPGLPVLAILMLLAALAISLGNWIDRRTIIRLDEAGICFENGLRNVQLGWSEIRQVQVFPSGWGKKIRVLGEAARFDFRTLGEVKLQGEVKGRMGFVEGEMILQHILEQAKLKQVEQSGASYYYARE